MPIVTLLLLVVSIVACYVNTGANIRLSSVSSPSRQETAVIIVEIMNFKEMDLYYLLVNAKYLFKLNTNKIHKMDNISFFMIDNIVLNNRYCIAMYGVKYNKIKLFDVQNIDINKTGIQIAMKSNKNQKYINYMESSLSLKHNILNYDINILLSRPRISTYYSVWQTLVTHSFNNISYNMQQMNIENKYSNNKAPNVDNVLQSNNSITLYDLVDAWNWTINASITNSSIKPVYSTALKFWHQQPYPLGYYCIYNDPDNKFGVANCSNITETLTEHSYMLSSSGIDFIVLDLTNHWDGIDDYYSWIWQIRPTQVLFEKWNAFRQNGTSTPYITVWNPVNGTQYQEYLKLYNKYPNMVYKAPLMNNSNITKYLYFALPVGFANQSCDLTMDACYNQTAINIIESNGGKNDIILIKTDATINITMYKTGFWIYMTPCMTKKDRNYMYWTSSVETLNECNQLWTENSPIGSQMATSFQWIPWANPWSSLPFASPTKLNGRTIQLQIADAIKVKPDYIFFPSFNEQHCPPTNINNNYGGNNTWSVGLYKDKKMRNTMYMDSYTAERSRTIEPSIESGDYYFRLMQSCIRVLRLSYYFNMIYNIDTKTFNELMIDKICNIEGEICCNTLTKFNDIWSIKNIKTNDFFVSDNYTEIENKIKNNNYSEICSPSILSNSSAFCNNENDLYSYDQHRGPFILLQNGTNPTSKYGSNPYVKLKRIPIYRCIDNKTHLHFIANDINCNNVTINYQNEVLLGYAMESPSSAMPRQLIRCKNTQIMHYYHAVDDDCLNNDVSSRILGYVL